MVQRQNLPRPVRNIIALTPSLVRNHHDTCKLCPYREIICRPDPQHLQQKYWSWVEAMHADNDLQLITDSTPAQAICSKCISMLAWWAGSDGPTSVMLPFARGSMHSIGGPARGDLQLARRCGSKTQN